MSHIYMTHFSGSNNLNLKLLLICCWCGKGWGNKSSQKNAVRCVPKLSQDYRHQQHLAACWNCKVKSLTPNSMYQKSVLRRLPVDPSTPGFYSLRNAGRSDKEQPSHCGVTEWNLNPGEAFPRCRTLDQLQITSQGCGYSM